MKAKRNYVNNRQLFEVMKIYVSQVNQAKEDNKPPPLVPNYVGECLLLISTRLASKPNFSGYSYREEMISDGIENSLMYIDNFDPNKSKNPFAYFTQIIKFSFIRRIEREKKQHYIKIKNLENFNITDELRGIDNKKTEMNEITEEFVKNFEKNLTNKKKNNKNGLNKFFN